MTLPVIRYILGGLLFSALCGTLIGMLLAVTLQKRLSKGTAAALLGLFSALLIGAALWILVHGHPDSHLQLPAGLLIYPFYNRLTAGTAIGRVLALLVDAGWMTVMATLAWNRIRLRQDRSRLPPSPPPNA